MADSKDVLHYIEKYEKKLGTKFFDDWSLDEYPYALVFPNGEISVYRILPDRIDIGASSGNLRNMLKFYKRLGKFLGVDKITTSTVHNPKAFARLSGAKLVSVNTDVTPTEYTFETEV